MQKSVYSIVLSDDVVACIDRLAYANGTSRSNMINQILAEHVSYTTPEKRRGDIFSKAVEMINAMDQLQVMLPKDAARQDTARKCGVFSLYAKISVGKVAKNAISK